jgi:hypothetical protein
MYLYFTAKAFMKNKWRDFAKDILQRESLFPIATMERLDVTFRNVPNDKNRI